MSQFAAFLKEELDRQGLTQKQMAEKMGMQQPTLNAMLKGKRLNVSTLVFCRMAQAVDGWPRRIAMFRAAYRDVEQSGIIQRIK